MAEASKTLGRALRLTIAGDGPDRQRLIELAGTCGVPADFVGWVDRSRRLEVLRKADLVAVPSLWPEPFGLTGLEGFCLGVPAVGYAVGGVPDWLIPGETGELAEGESPSVRGLAAALVRALSDPDRYARLSAGAWQFTRRFALDAHIATLEPLLDQAKERALSV